MATSLKKFPRNKGSMLKLDIIGVYETSVPGSSPGRSANKEEFYGY